MSVTEMSYPIFELNQTLSHHDLNNLFKYLNKQDLLTRANLVGTGIISGLEATFDEKENWIRISKGCGITSEGYIIFVPEDKYYRYYNKFEGNLLSCAKLPTITGTHYELDNTLRTEGIIIDKDTLTKNVVALHYEEIDQQASCCSIKDNRGSSNIVTIRVLLVPNGNIPKNDSLLSRSIVNEKISTPIQRLNTVTPDEIVEKLKGVAKNIKDNIGAAYNVFSTILRDVSIGIDTILGRIPQGKDNNTLNHYNFLCDLTEAYEEFRVCGEKVLLDYRPAAANFPCHLILNGQYRHHFRPATASDDYAQLNRLWSRIVTMIEYFNPDVASAPATDNSIRLTPSVYGAVPLSQKAVPYYYHNVINNQPPAKAIPYNVWTGRENDERGIGYWYEDEQKKYYGYYHQANLNSYDLEKYNFVRIEGHIGIPYTEDGTNKTVRENINDLAKNFQLPFKVVALSVEEESGRCISGYQKISFDILRKESNDVAHAIVEVAKKVVEPEELKKVLQDAELVFADVEKATTVDKVRIWARAAVTAMQDVGRKVTSGLLKVKKVAEEVTAMQQVATTAMANMTAVNDAKAKAKIAEKAVKNVEKAVKYASEEAKKAVAALEQAPNNQITSLDSYLKSQPAEQSVVVSNYNLLVLFAGSIEMTDVHCEKIIFFLHWLDATYTTYQQCKEFSSFKAFKDKHPGLQHKSGVPIGGTFILVYDANNKVIADFCLPYRVTQPD